MQQRATDSAAGFDLPTRERQFIVLVALLQGLLLYIAQYGHEHDWWPLNQLGGRICWYTLVLTVPTLSLLSLRRLGDPRFWQHALGALVLYTALAAWATWSATGPGAIVAAPVLMPFGATLAIGSFVLLPYLQVRLERGRWCAPYPLLFECAWQNALTLLLAGLFVGVSWSLLALWGALFKLIGIEFFATLFKQDPFVYLATGLLFGLGLLIGRTQHRPVRIARQILFALFKGLLPAVVLFSLLFLLSLPFTGLEPLWATRNASFILGCLIAYIVLLLNAVVQDGQGAPPYSHWLRRIVGIGLLFAPVFAVLAAIALWLRIGQYGWSVERFWAVVAIALLTAYAFGYALAILRRDGRWLSLLPQVNIGVSLAIVALMVLGNSPLLDPYRLSASSQLARFEAAAADRKEQALDEAYLRWELGRRGVLALQQVRADAVVQSRPDWSERIDKLLARSQRYAFGDPHARKIVDVDRLRDSLQLAAGADPADHAWLEAMVGRRLHHTGCLAEASDCVLLTPDADGDGQVEHLLCNLGDNVLNCHLSTRRNGQWVDAGTLTWWEHKGELPYTRIRAGELTLEPHCWPRIALAGLEAKSIETSTTSTCGNRDPEVARRER